MQNTCSSSKDEYLNIELQKEDRADNNWEFIVGLNKKSYEFAQFMYRYYRDNVRCCVGEKLKNKYLQRAESWKQTAQYLELEEKRLDKFLSWGKPKRR